MLKYTKMGVIFFNFFGSKFSTFEKLGGKKKYFPNLSILDTKKYEIMPALHWAKVTRF